MAIYLGVDPGDKGYICALDPLEGFAEFLSNASQPQQIIKELRHLQMNFGVKRVCVEHVHSIPRASAKSNFTFGFNVGMLHCAFLGIGFGVDLVTPKVWQKHAGILLPATPKGVDADATKKIAAARKKHLKESVGKICNRLYPDISVHGPQGGLLDGKSDALMIAHYAYHLHR